jgi:hypothetical protein
MKAVTHTIACACVAQRWSQKQGDPSISLAEVRHGPLCRDFTASFEAAANSFSLFAITLDHRNAHILSFLPCFSHTELSD